MGEGVAALDASGAFRYVSPAAAALLGRRGDELAGRTIDAVLPEATGLRTCLCRARDAGGTPLDWQGRLGPGGVELAVTAVAVGELLLVTLRPAGGGQVDGEEEPRRPTPSATGCGTWPRSPRR